MLLTIPDDIQSSLDMNEQELLLELAVALYAAKKISFGKARHLAGLVVAALSFALFEQAVLG